MIHFSARTLACPNGPTTYTLVATSLLGCVATSSVTVSFSQETAPQVSIPEQTICVGSSVMLSPQVSPASDYDYTWTAVPGLINPNSAIPTAIGASPGTQVYTLLVVDNNTGCATEAQAVVNVVGSDFVDVEINNSQLNCFTGNVPLGSTIEGPVSSFRWLTSGDGFFSPSPNVMNPNYIPGSNDRALQSVRITLEAVGVSCGNVTSRTVAVDLGVDCGDIIPVPTMSEWGFFLFGLLLFTVFIVGLFNVKKRGVISLMSRF
jgi:hypothetical protein